MSVMMPALNEPMVSKPQGWDGVYHQELQEVHLLLDFIAGRRDKRLTSLQIEVSEEFTDPADPAKTSYRIVKLGAPEIAGRISALRFPQEGSELKRSQDAAFPLLVKDQLCALAYPAKAESIAFTSLVASRKSRRDVLIDARADPDLEEIALRFRCFQKAATGAAVVLALIGAMPLAEATYGGQLTARLQAAKQNAAAVTAEIYAAYNAMHSSQALPAQSPKVIRVQNICPRTTLSASGGHANPATDPTESPDLSGNTDPNLIQICDKYAYGSALFENAIADVDAYARGPLGTFVAWLVPIHGLGHASCEPGDDPDHCGPKQKTGPSVSGMVAAFANYVLPLIFGVVGALSGVIRIIQDKIIASELVPRDTSLLWLRILLGGVAGGSVGLFFDPSHVAAEITSGNAGLSVSASGIVFWRATGRRRFSHCSTRCCPACSTSAMSAGRSARQTADRADCVPGAASD